MHSVLDFDRRSLRGCLRSSLLERDMNNSRICDRDRTRCSGFQEGTDVGPGRRKKTEGKRERKIGPNLLRSGGSVVRLSKQQKRTGTAGLFVSFSFCVLFTCRQISFSLLLPSTQPQERSSPLTLLTAYYSITTASMETPEVCPPYIECCRE